jgi:DNA-binding transcriptional regulator YiaG
MLQLGPLVGIKMNQQGEKMGQNDKIAESSEDELERKMRRGMGRRIAKARTALNMSQSQLAKMLGIERSRLSKWECGLHAPLLKQLVALAQALSLSLDDLITGAGLPWNRRP